MLILLTNSFFYLTPRAIVKALDLMKMDMVNFTLSTLKPHLMQQSAEYERQKFTEFLEKQPSEDRLGFVRFQKNKIRLDVRVLMIYFNFTSRCLGLH